jgi:preprotein translocase subunit SecG
MQKIKHIFIAIAILAMLGTAAVDAQTSDSTAATSTSTAMRSETTSAEGKESGMSKYTWIGVAVIVGIALLGGVALSSRKKTDDRPQSGGDINNPASGI